MYDRGYLEGPRPANQDELGAMGQAPKSPSQAVRAHCLDCRAGSAELAVRMGTSPHRKPPSDEQKQAMRERGRRLAKANKSIPSDAEDHGTGL
jgi:hypothetical protein